VCGALSAVGRCVRSELAAGARREMPQLAPETPLREQRSALPSCRSDQSGSSPWSPTPSDTCSDPEDAGSGALPPAGSAAREWGEETVPDGSGSEANRLILSLIFTLRIATREPLVFDLPGRLFRRTRPRCRHLGATLGRQNAICVLGESNRTRNSYFMRNCAHHVSPDSSGALARRLLPSFVGERAGLLVAVQRGAEGRSTGGPRA